MGDVEMEGEGSNPRLRVTCAGYEALARQGNDRLVRVTVGDAEVAEETSDGKALDSTAGAKGAAAVRPGSTAASGGWGGVGWTGGDGWYVDHTDRSFCFAFVPDEPSSVSRIVMRNAGTAFVTVYAGTLEQARFLLAHPSTDSSLPAARSSVRAPNAAGDAKHRSLDPEDVRHVCVSYAGNARLANGNSQLGTLGEWLGSSWQVVVPYTQLLMPDHLVRRTPRKYDGVRTFACAPQRAAAYAAFVVRCWPFYDRPANHPAPPEVGLHWVAFYGRPHNSSPPQSTPVPATDKGQGSDGKKVDG